MSNCIKHLLAGDVDGVGGPMQTIGEGHISEVIAIGMSSTFGVGGSAFRTMQGKTMFVDTVPFPAYTREIIDESWLV
jgi:succinoglycan biosynthesis protein ExoA